MFSRLLLIAGAAMAVPLPNDLTIEQFQEKTARSLEAVPGVRISKSYASIRRQGEGGAGASVNFPTLLVRDPLELFPIEKVAPSVGPVFRPKDASKIAEEIRKINEAEVEAREVLEAIEASGDADIGKITDIIAEEILEENLSAVDIAAEEVADEILQAVNIEGIDLDLLQDVDDSENEIIEGSGLSALDFGSITEVTL